MASKDSCEDSTSFSLISSKDYSGTFVYAKNYLRASQSKLFPQKPANCKVYPGGLQTDS